MNESFYEELAGYITERIIDDILGRSSQVCVGDFPRMRYFAGALSPGSRDRDGEPDDAYSRASPTSASLELLLEISGLGTIAVGAEFSCYYRVFPDFNRLSGNEIPPVFKKCRITVGPIELSESDMADLASGKNDSVEAGIRGKINEAMESFRKTVLADPMVFRKLPRRFRLPDFENEDEYTEYIRNLEFQEVVPEIVPELRVEVRPDDGNGRRFVLRISLENASQDEPLGDCDTGIYDFRLVVESTGEIRICPFEFYFLPEDYRYDRKLWGYGTNCTAVRTGENRVETETVPVYLQKKYQTREDIDVSFKRLAENPFEPLREIEHAMRHYAAEWRQDIENRRSEVDEEEYRARLVDLRKFEDEIERFSRGIAVIERLETARQAFILMNRTYQKLGKRKGFTEWRLFQIVFIVSVLPDIVAREYRELADESYDRVDLLWFPTGGGKTEAYLGLVIFSAFFDRLRGKMAGTTAIMRYPLRLLSLQQLQRIVEVFAQAEMVRREEGVGDDYAVFSAGFLTGKANTPNRVQDLVRDYGLRSLDELADYFKRNERIRDQFRLIEKCPFCGERVDVEILASQVRLAHVCRNENCPQRILPVYITDSEIYRYLPTMIVGVQDKLTLMSFQRRFSQILGNVHGLCPVHGYTNTRSCVEYGCGEKISKVYLKDPAPTIQIQDELHLLKEELGTFESHYFSLMEHLIRHYSDRTIKIIAATATIENYENQVRHLYLRLSARFPEMGPKYRESFYARETGAVQRIFVGIMPVNLTHINAAIKIIEKMSMLLQDIRRDPGRYARMFGVNENMILDALRQYRTGVIYVLARREGDRIHTSISTQANPNLRKERYSEITADLLTSETRWMDIPRLLEDLKNSTGPDEIIATSTISHGVDVENLNRMMFFGMPRLVAEYIQTSSRVGRKYPGIVFTLFHPIRERDQSHYRFSNKFHEYLDRLVEPVPVNRWAKFSLTRTLPGLFYGLLLQKYGTKLETEIKGFSIMNSNHLVRALSESRITQEDLVSDLERVYRSPKNGSVEGLERLIQDRVAEFMNEIMTSYTGRRMTTELIQNPPPMRSLRDVDEQIPVIKRRWYGE